MSIKILFLILAAAFNAAMDKTENENFYTSVFRKLNERFWYKRISWKYAFKVFGYKFDFWHLSKSAMLICLAAYASNTIWEFIGFGVVWIGVFVYCYSKLLHK